MEARAILLMGFLLVLVAVDCSDPDPKVNLKARKSLPTNSNDTDNNLKDGFKSTLNHSEDGGVNENRSDQVHGSKNGSKNDKDKSELNGQLDPKEVKNVQIGEVDSRAETNGRADKENRVKPGDNDHSKQVSEEGSNAGRKDDFREECDPSNMCTDNEKRFVACLQVPGNESPDLFLLIQNKGQQPLTITISVPPSVRIGKREVQIQEKKEKKVKVSVRTGGTNSLIVLKEGNGNCSLDFKDLVVHYSPKSYINFLSQMPIVAIVFLAAVLIAASGWTCIRFRRKQLASSDLKYQRLDMEIPVSGGTKIESDDDGWDNNWVDSWDDEEAPKTPSMPVTPSLSSKGLASRRLSKEGWKD